MGFTQPTGMKMQKSWPNRSNIPVCGMQTTANLNQCGIEGRARLPKSRREEGSCERGTAREENKSVLPQQSRKGRKRRESYCMAQHSALRWQSQRVAMAKSARRPSLGSTQLKGRGQDGSLDSKSRRLTTSIQPHGKRSR